MGTDEHLQNLMDSLDADSSSVVTSVRMPSALREALKIAVELGMDASANEAYLKTIRARVEGFAQRLALERHYRQHPEARPDLGALTLAAAQLDAHPLADQPELLRRAADEVVRFKPDADSSDVLMYAMGLGRAAEHA